MNRFEKQAYFKRVVRVLCEARTSEGVKIILRSNVVANNLDEL